MRVTIQEIQNEADRLLELEKDFVDIPDVKPFISAVNLAKFRYTTKDVTIDLKSKFGNVYYVSREVYIDVNIAVNYKDLFEPDIITNITSKLRKNFWHTKTCYLGKATSITLTPFKDTGPTFITSDNELITSGVRLEGIFTIPFQICPQVVAHFDCTDEPLLGDVLDNLSTYMTFTENSIIKNALEYNIPGPLRTVKMPKFSRIIRGTIFEIFFELLGIAVKNFQPIELVSFLTYKLDKETFKLIPTIYIVYKNSTSPKRDILFNALTNFKHSESPTDMISQITKIFDRIQSIETESNIITTLDGKLSSPYQSFTVPGSRIVFDTAKAVAGFLESKLSQFNKNLSTDSTFSKINLAFMRNSQFLILQDNPVIVLKDRTEAEDKIRDPSQSNFITMFGEANLFPQNPVESIKFSHYCIPFELELEQLPQTIPFDKNKYIAVYKANGKLLCLHTLDKDIALEKALSEEPESKSDLEEYMQQKFEATKDARFQETETIRGAISNIYNTISEIDRINQNALKFEREVLVFENLKSELFNIKGMLDNLENLILNPAPNLTAVIDQLTSLRSSLETLVSTIRHLPSNILSTFEHQLKDLFYRLTDLLGATEYIQGFLSQSPYDISNRIRLDLSILDRLTQELGRIFKGNLYD